MDHIIAIEISKQIVYTSAVGRQNTFTVECCLKNDDRDYKNGHACSS